MNLAYPSCVLSVPSSAAVTGCQWSQRSRKASSSESSRGTWTRSRSSSIPYKRPVFTTALAITRDPFLAEEILQDCFVKAYRVRQRLRRDVSPLPWLQRVTTNLCYSRISRRRAIAEPITQLITNLVTDLTSRPDQVAESREIIEVLQRGIDALPPKQQTAVILYYLHGYSLAEAAEIAECNVGTMKSRLHYALKTLRALLPAERRATALAPRMVPDELS